MDFPIDNSLFSVPAIIGVIFVVVGFVVLKFPPKKINSLYGYRTYSSMKSQERWDFAQIYASKEIIKLGVLLALSSLLGLVFEPSETIATLLGVGLMMLAVVALMIRVEAAIKKKFPSE